MNLTIDPDRTALPETGIPIRAELHGKWGTHDIAHLTQESLITWLRSRGGQNEWAESVVLLLLGHTAE